MWRAFFLAVGVMLIILGVECLVLDKFVVASRARMPAALSKIIDKITAPDPPAQGLGGIGQPNLATNPAQTPNAFGSQFGPSRFGTPYANGYQPPNFYGGNPTGQLNAPANSPFSLTAYGSPNTGGVNPVGSQLEPPSRVVQTKDWMPWCFLAVGTLVVLYTRSTGRQGFSS